MKQLIYSLSATLVLVFWPLSLIISNQTDWTTFALPALVILFDYFLYQKGFKYSHLVLLLIPLAVLFSSPKAFYTYSVFTPDPLRFDTLIKKINLIPNRNLARVFENKTTVPVEKYLSNLFLELELNNYFFALHPREIIGENQGLQKFPFLALFPFLYGLFLLPKHKDSKWIITIFIISILAVSFINNPDKFDFVLYLPVSLICLLGIKAFINHSPKLSLLIFPPFLLISLFELARIIVFK